MAKIQILPPELVNQIAAGEVVERPSSVVKELVENAIDAGAARIEILAGDGGRYLRIADNGCGMDQDDLEKAFHNHATSKVKSLEDLFQIHTLGFRGEALASVAAIAKVTCISRPADASTGQKAIVAPSGQVTLQETGCAPGTIFEIRELFYNVPARLKFLKRPQTELSHILETVQMLALSHPEIAFELKIEDAQALKTSGSGELLRTIHEVFSLAASDTLVPFEFKDEEAGYRAWGQTSTPNITRSSKKWMITFVNGRGVRCPIISKAIESAYQSMAVPGKFPITVLFLELPVDEVDVNVHPTKREVKYQRANTMFSFIRRALEGSLIQPQFYAKSQSSAASGAPIGPSLTKPSPGMSHRGDTEKKSPSKNFGTVITPQRSFPGQASSSETQLHPKPAYSQAALNMYSPESSSPETVAPGFALPLKPEFNVIGQLSRTYILVETSEGLLVVDQHIASERVRFEWFADQAERSEPASQHLLLPMSFPMSPGQATRLIENNDALEKLGFHYHLENQMVHFSRVPSLYNEKVLKTSLEALLANLEETEELKLAFEDVLATAACHSAVRAGDFLTLEQMQRVIQQWFECNRPWTCPHGRPVYHLVSHQELMHFFERPSLPQQRENFAPTQ